MTEKKPIKRVLLKCSGEFLGAMDRSDAVYNETGIADIVRTIRVIYDQGVQIVVVCGGGNIRRWKDTQSLGIPRVRSDTLGIMATVMNATVLASSLVNAGIDAEAMVPAQFHHPECTTLYRTEYAIDLLNAGGVVVCGGGTGNPYSTTDSGAVLRALELGCDAVVKGTTVDGVYDKDPNKYDDAVRYEEVSYKKALQHGLAIMDLGAFGMAKENDLDIYVTSRAGLERIGTDDFVGTRVHV